jgi:peptidylprolyl isomerase
LLSTLVLGSVACQDDDPGDGAGSGSTAPRRLVEPIKPPIDVKKPPEDATKTASGLVYKKLTANEAGAQPTRHGAALVQYAGWRERTGDTFFTTKGRDQPIALDLATAAPGFAEALTLLHKGEKAMVWIPSSPGTTDGL